MRTRDRIIAASVCISALAVFTSREASAQTVTPAHVQHDETWGTVSNVAMVVGAGLVTVMPRVYYNDPESTVGWKGRWHLSVLAPAMTLVAATWLVDSPIKNGIESTRPGCPVDLTRSRFPGTGCETFGGPSTQSFASWGATGAGVGIFLMDTFKYSDGRFNGGAFVGNVLLPLTASVITSVGRGVEPGNKTAYESPGQIVAGGLPGLGVGLLMGLGYAAFQQPGCGYGNGIICW